MFEPRRGSRLTPADLRRFGPKFLEDLSAFWPDRRAWLLAPDEPAPAEAEPLEAEHPLIYKGRELGRLIVANPLGLAPPPGYEETRPVLIRQGLETMALRKALLTDRETGLYGRDYFHHRLLKALSQRREGAVKSLSMDGGPASELLLVMVELREAPEPHSALSKLAARLAEHLPSRHLSRLGTRRLGFLVEGRPEEIRLSLENALDAQLTADPASRPVAAWARYPHDLANEDSASETTEPGRLRRQARVLEDKARAALFQARQSRGAAVGVAFGDLLESHGQVIQVLPLDRVVVNLGRATGAAAGQVFLISSPTERPGAEPEYKGEVTLFETADSYSLGHLSGHKPARRIVAGDHLTFSRRSDPAAAGERRSAAAPGFLAELPGREEFSAGLARAKSRPLALVLARLDGFEKNLAVLGREEADRLLAFAFEKVAASLPATPLMTWWRSDILALAWPEGAQAELGPAAHRLADDLRESGPVSLGLVFSPGRAGGSPEDLVEDGLKALSEASFSGFGQVAVFGPLALNISGDRYFEGGDLMGAIREYERGLSLAADHLNLLNSLGVCYGRLGDAGRALEIFDRIIELAPRDMMAHYNLGYTHLLAGRLVEAEEALGRAAELAPDNFESLFHLGRTALELGHLDRALAALKRAGELSDTRPIVFRLLGEALMLAHDYQGAARAFKKAVKTAPNDAYSLSALGALFVDLTNDLEVAKSLFQRSVEIDPTNTLYRQRLGRLLFTLGDFSGAEHHLTLALEYGSRAPEVPYQLGRVAEETGRPQEALNHFKAALERDPAYQPALDRVHDHDDPEAGWD